MGVDFSVAVQAANWPTVQSLQQCIDDRGWPVRLRTKEQPYWTKPLQTVPMTVGIPVVFNGEPIDLEASIVTLSKTESFGYTFDRSPDLQSGTMKQYRLQPDETLKPSDISETLSKLGASVVKFTYGDRVLTLSFRSKVKPWKAGFYAMAALIKCSGGYGFELQEGKHGGSDSADELAKAAADEDWK
jgi:hypothetical protein